MRSRQWIGSPSWFDDNSRTSTIVRRIVSGKSGAGLGCGLHSVTGEKRKASSAVRSLRPGAAGIFTLNRAASGKPSANVNSGAEASEDSSIFRFQLALIINSYIRRASREVFVDVAFPVGYEGDAACGR